MTRRTRLALGAVAIGSGILAVLAVPVGILAATFAAVAPAVDGEVLPGGATTVLDGYVASFLVPVGEGRYALVDAGQTRDGAPIDRALAAKGAARADVVAILLTHGHRDHVGACDGFPSATVYALRAELPVLAGEVAAKGPLPRLFGAERAPCAGAITAVDDGEIVPIGSTKAVARALPGHTGGSVAYVIDGVVYFGDAASAGRDGDLIGPPWIFSDDQAQAEASIAALARRVAEDGTEIRGLAFAHSGSLAGGAALAAWASR